MEGIAGPVAAVSSPEDAKGLVLLKKSQDLMTMQANALLATLPPPRSLPPPSPSGLGGQIDVVA